MQSEINALQAENERLFAETLALQTMLFSLLGGLESSGALSKQALEQVFDSGAELVDGMALKIGQSASHRHTAGAHRIIETLRQQFFAAK